MTLGTTELQTLVAAGVPQAAVDDLLTGLLTDTSPTDGDVVVQVHGESTCPEGRDVTPATTAALLPPRLGEAWILACADCTPPDVYFRNDAVLVELHVLAGLVADVSSRLNRAAAVLAGQPVGLELRAAGDHLRSVRPLVDPALARRRPDRPLGDPLGCWADAFVTAAHARLTPLLAAYAATGIVEQRAQGALAFLGTRLRPRTAVPGTDHYVAVYRPGDGIGRAELEAAQDILLVHTPQRWLADPGRELALYRLPGHLAGLLLDVCGPETALDGGPVADGDTDEVLDAAAALFDDRDLDAPLADLSTAFTAARDLLAG